VQFPKSKQDDEPAAAPVSQPAATQPPAQTPGTTAPPANN
jgi:hypothetical protein